MGMKYEDLRLEFDKHVIYDVRTGVTFLSDSPSSTHAIMETVRQLGLAEFERLSEDHKKAIMDLSTSSLQAILRTGRPNDGSVLEVIQVGPFVTIGGSLHEKNMKLLTDRYMAMVNGEVEVGELDYKLHEWLVKQVAKNKARVDRQNRDADEMAGSSLGALLGGLGICL